MNLVNNKGVYELEIPLFGSILIPKVGVCPSSVLFTFIFGFFETNLGKEPHRSFTGLLEVCEY